MRIICALFICLFSTMAFANVVIDATLPKSEPIYFKTVHTNKDDTGDYNFVTLHFKKKPNQYFDNVDLNTFDHIRGTIQIYFQAYNPLTKEYKATLDFASAITFATHEIDPRTAAMSVTTKFNSINNSEMILTGHLESISQAKSQHDFKLGITDDGKRIVLILNHDIPVQFQINEHLKFAEIGSHS